MRYWQRLFGLLVLSVCLVSSVVVPVAAAPSLVVQATRRDATGAVVFAPAITDRQGVLQPPIAVPGEYLVVTGAGFPPNAPITASFNDGTKTIPLTYQDLAASVTTPQQTPVTNAVGGIGGAAFQVPPAAQIAGKQGTLAVSVAGVVSGAIVNIDLPDANAAAGDQLVVGAALAFYVVIAVVFARLLRGLPTYPPFTTTRSSR